MKKVLGIFLMLCLLLGYAYSDDFGDDGLELYFVMCNPDSYVNVRPFPNKKNEPSGRLYYGDSVWFDGQRKNGYMHIIGVSNEMGEGWVYKIYLDIWEPMDNVEGTYFNSSRYRVKLRNGINGKRIGWLKPGQEVNVLGMSAEWAITNKGYVKAEYLEEVF